jgi:hypothetical protein
VVSWRFNSLLQNYKIVADTVFERLILMIVNGNIFNYKESKSSEPRLMGARMSENTASAIESEIYK